MMLFRSAHENDLEAIHQLATQSGVVGITTLPKDIELLKQRLAWSISSFNKAVNEPGNEYYLFVMEDHDSGKVIGTSAIEATTGHNTPFYSYKISKRTRICHELNIRNDYEVLSIVNDNQGQSEICTLFLDPAYRVNNNGSLLSRARFLFIANFPMRFTPTIIAEMRGMSDNEGQSPFWDHVGSHFFPMTYAEADRLTLSTNKQFIADLMPRQTVYVKLLAPAAQAVIGKPHQSALPAMNILLKEGFRYNNYVDIFDAGPTIEAPRDQIRTITSSKLMRLEDTLDEIKSVPFLLANTALDYRATVGRVALNEHQDACYITHKTAQVLQIHPGEQLRISPLGLSS